MAAECEIIYGNENTGIYAFYGSRNSLESIEFPPQSKLKTIGSRSFQKCSKLKSIDFTNCEYLTTISTSAFYYCQSLLSVVLPKNLKDLSGSTFQGCNITSINIPRGLTELSGYCFANCKMLHTIHFEDDLQLTKIQKYALASTQLSEFKIPRNVVYVDGTAFAGISTLVLFECDTYNEYYIVEDGVLYTKDKKKLIVYPKNHGTEFTLPDGLETIGNSAFSYTSIEHINLNSNLKTIKESAFSDSNLKSIIIPDSVTSIEGYTFRNCVNLTSVSIGSGVETIPVSCFENSNISNISLSEGLTRIESHAFISCNNLKYIFLPKSIEYLGGGCFPSNISIDIANGSLFSADSQLLLYSSNKQSIVMRFSKLEQYDIPASVEEIKDYIFQELLELKTINFPSNSKLNTIGSLAFLKCKNLANINFPESLRLIGVNAFRFCSSIKNLHFKGLTVINNGAFEGCTSLESVIFDESERLVLRPGAFSSCINLKTVIFNTNLTEISSSVFLYCAFTELEIPGSIQSIGSQAFFDSKLEKLIISSPSMLRILVANAFRGANCLTDINLPEDIQKINENAFENTNISSFIVPKQTTSISEYAFRNCKRLEKFIIPENCSLQRLGYFIFEGCFSLKSFECNGSEFFEVENFALFNKNKTSLICFPPACECKYFYVPATLREISGAAFYCCRNLVNILIPDNSVRTICRYAFANCTSLTHINIPNSVTVIETHIFYNCFSLTCGIEIQNKSISFLKELIEVGHLDKNAVQECRVITCVKKMHYRYYMTYSLAVLSQDSPLGIF